MTDYEELIKFVEITLKNYLDDEDGGDDQTLSDLYKEIKKYRRRSLTQETKELFGYYLKSKDKEQLIKCIDRKDTIDLICLLSYDNQIIDFIKANLNEMDIIFGILKEFYMQLEDEEL